MDFKNGAGFLKPDLGEGVGALFTERLGGVSSGPWGGPDAIMGLNVSLKVGDNEECVRMNRSIVSQMTPTGPRWMTQVHGTKVVCADDVDDESQYTTTPGVVCTVQVADCLPVLISAGGAAVAAVHAGWKSLAAGVIEETLEVLKSKAPEGSQNLRAWLGPRIDFDDFEVGEDVVGVFLARYPEAQGCIKMAGSGKAFVDLAGIARSILEKAGCTVEDCGLSTVADPARFYSYRRDGEKTGRHAALIWIEPEK